MPKTVAKLEDFEVLQTIGTGSFGTCRKVLRKADGKVFVWKEIDYGGMTEKEKQLLVQEVNLLRELRHPHIVRYHDRIIAPTEGTLYIIMEHCQGGDLAAIIAKCRTERRHLEELFVWHVFHQLLQALGECHRKRTGVHKVLHRDLKPANVFLDGNNNVKLGDFGLARILHHNFSLAKTFVGTPYYMSPEQLREQEYDERSDLWSLGCLVYELCTLAPPFPAPNQQVLEMRVREGRFRRIPQQYSAELQAIIASLLQTQPEKRPDIPELLQRVSPRVSDSGATPMGDGGKTTSELSSWEAELRQREERVRGRERAVLERERKVAAREKAVQEREARLRLLEKGHHLVRLPLEPVNSDPAQAVENHYGAHHLKNRCR